MKTNFEFRKLGGAGVNPASLNLPPRFVEKLKWKGGDYIIVTLDESHQQIVLKKAQNF